MCARAKNTLFPCELFVFSTPTNVFILERYFERTTIGDQRSKKNSCRCLSMSVQSIRCSPHVVKNIRELMLLAFMLTHNYSINAQQDYLLLNSKFHDNASNLLRLPAGVQCQNQFQSYTLPAIHRLQLCLTRRKRTFLLGSSNI